MPYSDPEKERKYQAEYRARRKALKEKEKPLKETRIYLNVMAPNVTLGAGVVFRHGFCITSNPNEQKFIEGHGDFLKHIWPLALGHK